MNGTTLSTDCVTASSVNMFKNKFYINLRRAGYAYMKNVGLSISLWLLCSFAIWVFALDAILLYLVKPLNKPKTQKIRRGAG